LHSVTIDRTRNLIEVRLKGFFSPEDAGWMGEEVREAIRTLGTAAGQHVTLYDVSKVKIASKPTIAMMIGVFGNPVFRDLWARRVAFYSTSALGRLQLQRVCDVREDVGIFEDRPAALAWLLS